jgi:hypothetical protein
MPTAIERLTAEEVAEVPEVDPTAVVDPHWLELRGQIALPTVYLPPAMGGIRPRWMRFVSLVLVSIFGLATALGVCLTYGPPGLH